MSCARWPASIGSSIARRSSESKLKSGPRPPLSAAGTISSLWGKAASAKHSRRNTPLVTEACDGEVTVTDPAHPLFGMVLKLTGFAYLPGQVQHCQVEIFHDQCAYIPVRCTHLSQEPRSEPTLLSATAIAELVAIFQAVAPARRLSHAKRKQSPRLGTVARKRTRCGRRGNRARPHGGGGK